MREYASLRCIRVGAQRRKVSEKGCASPSFFFDDGLTSDYLAILAPPTALYLLLVDQIREFRDRHWRFTNGERSLSHPFYVRRLASSSSLTAPTTLTLLGLFL